MKKLTNLIALVMLVNTNVLTLFTYAQGISENNTRIVENKESYLDFQQNEEGEDYQKVIQGENNSEETDEELNQEQNLNIAEIDPNPIHLNRNGELIGTYTGLSQAISEAESGDVVKLIDDISVSEASVISGKSLTIDGDNHTITRIANIRTITVNEGSSLKLVDITITDNAVNFAPNRYNSLLTAKSNIPLCLGGVDETKDGSGEIIASVCATENVDAAKTNPQIYSVGDIYGDNLTISNSLNSNGSAAIIVEKGGIEMVNSSFIHNGSSGGGRGGAILVGQNTATNIIDKSLITKIVFSGCYFEDNYSSSYGGALAFHYAPEEVTIDNCIFSGNTAYSNGGAIGIPAVGWRLPGIPAGSSMPVGTLHVNNTYFYNNWVGNDGAVIENEDVHLEINYSYFEHNYGTQPLNTSVGVIFCYPGRQSSSRGLIWRNYKINNSTFRDTNVTALGDAGSYGSFIIDGCTFENQLTVLLTRNGMGEIKNSTIKNSCAIYCGKKGYNLNDFDVYPDRNGIKLALPDSNGSIFKLENNTYSNDCTTNEYFQIRNINYTTGISNIIIENEENTKVMVHRKYYDSVEIEGTPEVYYGVTIDDGNYAYIKKDKFYDFDEFNTELVTFSTGYQLESGKAMLFYLDSGYAELWSGSIHTTTNLYGKETDIHNITYEGMDGIYFEGITHTYKFINLDHTQYLTELTPYILNTPSRNGYRFEGRFLDSEYSIPVTSIEAGTTGDITLYAKREKLGTSGGGGGGGSSNKPDTPKEDEKPSEIPEQSSQDDIDAQDSHPDKETSEQNPQNDDNGERDSQQGQNNLDEFQQAYNFAHEKGITTMPTIQKAKMNTPLTRIAMAKMLSQYAVNVLGKEPDLSKGVISFNDVTRKMDSDYGNGVILAYQLGIMGQNMSNNKFRPNDEVTRAEFVTALSRMLYNTSDGEYKSTSKYYTHHMEKLEKEGIITKNDPNMKEKRGYVMIMLMRSSK